MDLSIQLLNARIKQQQFDELDNDFKKLTEAQQVIQLNYLFESALRMSIKYDFMQNIAVRILTTNTPPAPFIEKLTSWNVSRASETSIPQPAQEDRQSSNSSLEVMSA